jgi:hypothetical protein
MRILKGRKKILNTEYILIFNSIYYLKILFTDQSKLDKIEKIHIRTLKEYDKTLNIKHISILRIINNFNNLYIDQGKLDEIEKIYI